MLEYFRLPCIGIAEPMRRSTFSTLLTGVLALVPTFLSAQEGSLDPTFNATDGGFGNSDGADVGVNVTVIQPDGKILIGGGFGSYNNVQNRSLA